MTLWLQVLATACLVSTMLCSTSAMAQAEVEESRPTPQEAARPAYRKPVVPPAKPLNAQEEKGAVVFSQRCTLCHTPKIVKPNGYYPSVGPNLAGLFKRYGSDADATVRQKILRGSATMPGFEYGLKPTQIDDLIAYLKTL